MSKIYIEKHNEDERLVLGVVLEPTSSDTPDLHNDFYEAEEVSKACENFNTYCMNTNVEHVFQLPDDSATITKSFIMPVDCCIGDQEVKEGTWIQEWKIHSEDLWAMVKSEDFTGFSIGGTARVEDYNDVG